MADSRAGPDLHLLAYFLTLGYDGRGPLRQSAGVRYRHANPVDSDGRGNTVMSVTGAEAVARIEGTEAWAFWAVSYWDLVGFPWVWRCSSYPMIVFMRENIIRDAELLIPL